MKRAIFVLLIIIITAGCIKQPSVKDYNIDKDYTILADWLTGEFSSQQQAESDTSFLNIHLIMYPILQERGDGIWIYVEQALASQPDKPYRQRVYCLKKLRYGLYESRVFSIDSARNFTGAYRHEDLRGLEMNDLELKKGCSIVIRRKCQLIFEGSTVGKTCRSDLHGADYARSEVEIRENRMLSHDRGFDNEGNQIWGPGSPYIFIKKENFPIE
ncbi:MAG: chromophore lyase CpcT/CpeT [bacterium]